MTVAVTDNGTEAPPAAGLSFDEILEAKRPETEQVTIVLDPDRDPPLRVTFRFEAVSRVEWEKLIDDHPPSVEQAKEHLARQIANDVPVLQRTALTYNRDTFRPAVLAATCREPAMTVDQADRLLRDDRWSFAEMDRLWSAAMLVNTRSRRVSLGKEYEAILASVLNSQQPTTT